MTNAKSKEFDIDKMKESTNPFQRASNKRIFNKQCSKCPNKIGEVGGKAFRTSKGTWYCYNCNPIRRLK